MSLECVEHPREHWSTDHGVSWWEVKGTQMFRHVNRLLGEPAP